MKNFNEILTEAKKDEITIPEGAKAVYLNADNWDKAFDLYYGSPRTKKMDATDEKAMKGTIIILNGEGNRSTQSEQGWWVEKHKILFTV